MPSPAGLQEFRPLPHRLELVGDRGGLRWVNDSKATNVAATCGALRSLEGPLVLLLGGKDKGEELEPLREAMHPGVRACGPFRRGPASGWRPPWRDAVPIQVVDGSFEDAVDAGLELAQEGDILLLSPACSSFDMFRELRRPGDSVLAPWPGGRPEMAPRPLNVAPAGPGGHSRHGAGEGMGAGGPHGGDPGSSSPLAC